jgi:hypothetical protein
VNTEVTAQIEKLSQQFNDVLKKKADLLAIEQMISEKESERIKELESLQQTIERKASQDELVRLKKAIEKDLHRALSQQATHTAQHQHEMLEVTEDGRAATTAIGRQHYRCVACDRVAGTSTAGTTTTIDRVPADSGTMSFFDLAPNIAYKRWIVRDLIRQTKAEIAARQAKQDPEPPSAGAATSKGARKPATRDKPATSSKRPGSAPTTLPPIDGFSSQAPTAQETTSTAATASSKPDRDKRS